MRSRLLPCLALLVTVRCAASGEGGDAGPELPGEADGGVGPTDTGPEPLSDADGGVGPIDDAALNTEAGFDSLWNREAHQLPETWPAGWPRDPEDLFEGGSDRAAYVRQMFGEISHRYDLVNRVMTVGQDQSWRRLAASQIVRPGDTVLDAGLENVGSRIGSDGGDGG